MSLTRLSPEEVETRLQDLGEWSQLGEEIQRTYHFDDFAASMAFVERIAAHAERVAHHPDILIRYNRVTLSISTHDAGGLTEKDFDFAREADSIGGA